VVNSVFARCARAEAPAKGLVAATDDDPAALRAENARLRRDLEIARERTFRADERAKRWRTRYAAHEAPVCVTCGAPVVPDHGRAARSLGEAWRHRDPAADAPCAAARSVENSRWPTPIRPRYGEDEATG